MPSIPPLNGQPVLLTQALVEREFGDETAQQTDLACHFSRCIAPLRSRSGRSFEDRLCYDFRRIACFDRFFFAHPLVRFHSAHHDGGTHRIDGVERISLRYPDGPHDAEAMFERALKSSPQG